MRFQESYGVKNVNIEPKENSPKVLDVQGVSGSSPLASTTESPEPQGVQDFSFSFISSSVSNLLVTSMLCINGEKNKLYCGSI